MPSDIYWEYCVAMSSKTWSLLPNFNEFIMRVAQSGIQKNWELMVNLTLIKMFAFLNSFYLWCKRLQCITLTIKFK